MRVGCRPTWPCAPRPRPPRPPVPTDVGRPLYPDGLVRAGGPAFVQVPSLEPDECLIYDAAQVRLIVRRDFSVEFDKSAGFARDVTMVRVIGRFAVGVPVENKHIRKLTIETTATASAAKGGTGTRSHHAAKPNGA